MATTTKNCPFCHRPATSPHKLIDREGKITNCCVGEIHDEHIVPLSNHATFVATARKAGITGEW